MGDFNLKRSTKPGFEEMACKMPKSSKQKAMSPIGLTRHPNVKSSLKQDIEVSDIDAVESTHSVSISTLKGIAAAGALMGGSVLFAENVKAEDVVATTTSTDRALADQDVVVVALETTTTETSTSGLYSTSSSVSESMSSSESLSTSESSSVSNSESISASTYSMSMSANESSTSSETVVSTSDLVSSSEVFSESTTTSESLYTSNDSEIDVVSHLEDNNLLKGASYSSVQTQTPLVEPFRSYVPTTGAGVPSLAPDWFIFYWTSGFTQQPKDMIVAPNETFTLNGKATLGVFHVASLGWRIQYQWFVFDTQEGVWGEANEGTSQTLKITKNTSGRYFYQLRAEITDPFGLHPHETLWSRVTTVNVE